MPRLDRALSPTACALPCPRQLSAICDIIGSITNSLYMRPSCRHVLSIRPQHPAYGTRNHSPQLNKDLPVEEGGGPGSQKKGDADHVANRLQQHDCTRCNCLPIAQGVRRDMTAIVQRRNLQATRPPSQDDIEISAWVSDRVRTQSPNSTDFAHHIPISGHGHGRQLPKRAYYTLTPTPSARR